MIAGEAGGNAGATMAGSTPLGVTAALAAVTGTAKPGTPTRAAAAEIRLLIDTDVSLREKCRRYVWHRGLTGPASGQLTARTVFA